MEAVLLMGVQASGKTTFYRERFFSTHVRINLDMLKTRHREKRLMQVCLEIRRELELPMKEAYDDFTRQMILSEKGG